MFFMSEFFFHDSIHINELKKHNYSSQNYIVVFLEGFKKNCTSIILGIWTNGTNFVLGL